MDIERITEIARCNRYFSSMPIAQFECLQKLREATIGFPIGMRAIIPVKNRRCHWQWAVASPRHASHRVKPEMPTDLVKQWTGSNMIGNTQTEIYGRPCGVSYFGLVSCRVQVVFCSEHRFTEMRFATHILQKKFYLASGTDDEVWAAQEACRGFYLK